MSGGEITLLPAGVYVATEEMGIGLRPRKLSPGVSISVASSLKIVL